MSRKRVDLVNFAWGKKEKKKEITARVNPFPR
jgi:hypothetical protein